MREILKPLLCGPSLSMLDFLIGLQYILELDSQCRPGDNKQWWERNPRGKLISSWNGNSSDKTLAGSFYKPWRKSLIKQERGGVMLEGWDGYSTTGPHYHTKAPKSPNLPRMVFFPFYLSPNWGKQDIQTCAALPDTSPVLCATFQALCVSSSSYCCPLPFKTFSQYHSFLKERSITLKLLSLRKRNRRVHFGLMIQATFYNLNLLINITFLKN